MNNSLRMNELEQPVEKLCSNPSINTPKNIPNAYKMLYKVYS